MPRGTGGRWGGAAGSGSVSSVGLTVPTGLSVTGSPVTGTGTIAMSYSSDWPAHYMIVGPASGAATTPTRRQLIHSELSALNADDHSAVYIALEPAAVGRNVISSVDVDTVALTIRPADTSNVATLVVEDYDGSNAIHTFDSAYTTLGNIIINAAGAGLKIKEGSNATMGTVTANGTTGVDVNTTKVTANSRIFLTLNTVGGTPSNAYVFSRSAGSKFTIKASALDTSTYAWMIVEPA
jgi:hypothetical protein